MIFIYILNFNYILVYLIFFDNCQNSLNKNLDFLDTFYIQIQFVFWVSFVYILYWKLLSAFIPFFSGTIFSIHTSWCVKFSVGFAVRQIFSSVCDNNKLLIISDWIRLKQLWLMYITYNKYAFNKQVEKYAHKVFCTTKWFFCCKWIKDHQLALPNYSRHEFIRTENSYWLLSYYVSFVCEKYPFNFSIQE